MQQTSFYSKEELVELGLRSYGKDVKISRFVRFYNPDKISIGDNVRIDDFCILSGNIALGSNIHISPYVALYGALGIVMEDNTGISAKCTVYSAMDDFSGDYLIGPIHDDSITNVTGGPIVIKQFAQIGAHCVVFPNLTIDEGVAVGACSLVTKSLSPWGIYVGVPAKFLKQRTKRMLQYTNEKIV